jgi:hypothetical protein
VAPDFMICFAMKKTMLGLGYLMSDGCFCAHFFDNTALTAKADGTKSFIFFDETNHAAVYTFDAPPQHLATKASELKYYMSILSKCHKKQDDLHKKKENLLINADTRLLHWHVTGPNKDQFNFLLSNGSLQVINHSLPPGCVQKF